MRDESRHVSFGHTYLTPMIAKMHPDDVEDLAQFAFDGVNILIQGQTDITDGFLKVLEVSGIEPSDFAAGISEAAGLGLVNKLPPGQVHSLNDLMIPALVRAGLVTPRTRKLFEEVGVPVNENLTILNAMEDAKSDQSVLNEAGASY